MSSLRTALLAAAASFAMLSAGCHTCEDHEQSTAALEMAKFNYENGKYDHAKTLYSRCVEKCSDNQEGWLGLANACRETGNNQFKGAADLAGQGKIGDSKRLFKEAVDNHAMSYELFQRRLRNDPDDMAAHYGLGLLYYQRATNVLPFPFPMDDTVNRRKERDLAITEFSVIVRKAPQAWQAHRYLGLALFSAGRMDEGRPHLKRFHDAQQSLYERVLGWPGSSDDEKKRKETALQAVNKEIEDIRDVLGEYFMMVNRDYDRLKAKRERTPEEEAQMAKYKSESLQLENIIKGFHLTNLGPVEQELRRRCDDYFTVFNRGQVAEIMSFSAPKAGDEAAFQRAVQDKVQDGTQFRKPQYRTIVVSGDTASVGLVCEVVNRKGTRPDAEVTMHWRLVAGQWKVADLP
jgi:tetratricopeptide (TPR) repeat protein